METEQRAYHRKRRRRRRGCGGWLLLLAVLLIGAFFAARHWNLLPERSYTAARFGVETAVSTVDYNHNGVDDYADLLAGARADAKNRPKYDGAYCEGGYPSREVGVCTDLVWRAFRAAGYSLKDMVDADIARRPGAYPTGSAPDPNIDFRRVANLQVFFETYALCLSEDLTDIAQWQSGDIVIFGDNAHIGILSDKRNSDGVPWLLHNSGQPRREENVLGRTEMPLTAHYRFDASRIDPSVLLPWQEES